MGRLRTCKYCGDILIDNGEYAERRWSCTNPFCSSNRTRYTNRDYDRYSDRSKWRYETRDNRREEREWWGRLQAGINQYERSREASMADAPSADVLRQFADGIQTGREAGQLLDAFKEGPPAVVNWWKNRRR